MNTLVENFRETTEDFSIIGKVITLVVLTIIVLSTLAIMYGVLTEGAPIISLSNL